MNGDLRTALRSLWPYLPAWLVASASTCLAGGFALLAGVGMTPVTMLLGGVLVGPVWAATVAAAGAALDGTEVTVRSFLDGLRRHGFTGIRVAVVPAVACALELVAVAMFRAQPGQTWLLAPVAVGGVASVALLLASVFAFPVRIGRGLRGRTLWLTALSVAAVRPVLPLGVVAFGVLALLTGTTVSAALLLLAPAPLALLNAAALRSAAATLR